MRKNQLYDAPVISYQPVDFFLHVGKLCIDGSAEAGLLQRKQVFFHQFPVGGRQFPGRCVRPVAVNAVCAGVAGNMAGETAVFTDDKSSFSVRFYLQRPEIIVDASEIPSLLVEPAAGVVHRTGGVFFSDQLCDPGGVKLSPAFIERNPDRQRRHVAKMIHRIQTLLLPGGAFRLVRP